MIPDEIKTMWAAMTPAEQNAEMAKVMGWRKISTYHNPHGTIAWDCGAGEERYTGDVTPWVHVSLWQPTRDISAAMEVARKIITKDVALRLDVYADGAIAYFQREDAEPPYPALADSPEGAICLAARLAVETQP